MINKEQFISGLLEIAKNNLKKNGYLIQVLFIYTDNGMIPIAIIGNKDNLKDQLIKMGEEFAKDDINIETIFLLSYATSKVFPIEMKEALLAGNISKNMAIQSMEKTDVIIIVENDLVNDRQSLTLQRYHKEDEKVIFDDEPLKMENAFINLLTPFVYNYLNTRNNKPKNVKKDGN